MTLLNYLSGIAGAFAFGGAVSAIAIRAIARMRNGPAADDLLAVVTCSPDALLHLGPDLRCAYASPAATRLLGWPMHSLIGAGLPSLFPADAADAVAAAVERARGGWDGADVQIRTQSANGDQLWIEARLNRAGEGFVASLRDVSTRKTAELALRVANTELNRLAGSDSLTGLASRRRFEQLLESACRRASRQSAPVSMLLIDVDAHGPAGRAEPAGDLCLTRVAGALRNALGSNDTAARFAGEEFAVMLPGRDTAAALVEADRIREAVEAVGFAPGAPRGGHGRVAASIGCATLRPGPEAASSATATALIAHASRALERARPIGRTASAPAALGKPGWSGGLRDAAA